MATAAGYEIDANTPARREVSERIADIMQEHVGKNRDHRIELRYRYRSGVTVCADGDEGVEEAPCVESDYVPTTWPGARAYPWLLWNMVYTILMACSLVIGKNSPRLYVSIKMDLHCPI